jgi:type II secretory pathway component PulJ
VLTVVLAIVILAILTLAALAALHWTKRRSADLDRHSLLSHELVAIIQFDSEVWELNYAEVLQ